MFKQTQSLSNASLRSRPIIVHVTREQLKLNKAILVKKTHPRTKHEVDRMTRC